MEEYLKRIATILEQQTELLRENVETNKLHMDYAQSRNSEFDKKEEIEREVRIKRDNLVIRRTEIEIEQLGSMRTKRDHWAQSIDTQLADVSRQLLVISEEIRKTPGVAG